MKLKLLLASMLTLTLAASSQAQNEWEWFETEYSPQVADFVKKPLHSWPSHQTQVYDWWASFSCHYIVTGSETQDPGWRLLFGAIAANQWWHREDWSAEIPAGYIVTNYVDYYVRWGENTFEHLLEELTASRELDEKVTNGRGVFWEADLPPVGGPGGGA